MLNPLKIIFKKLYSISKELSSITKGKSWGKALMEFAIKNPKKFVARNIEL